MLIPKFIKTVEPYRRDPKDDSIGLVMPLKL